MVVGLMALACGIGFAQKWPSKSVKIVTALGAGRARDSVAGLYTHELQTEYGQPFVVENKPDASGIIAAEYVAKTPADDYMVLLSTNNINSGNPHLFKKLPYDPLKDFTAIARICNFLFVLAVPIDQFIQTVAELIGYSKENPNKVSFAYGNSTGQIAGDAFTNLAGLNGIAITYKSTPQALTALVGREVTYLFVDLASSQLLLKRGRLRVTVATDEASAWP